MKVKTKAELKEEIQTLRDRMVGIVNRCGLDLPEAKDKPEGYYRGRLAMIQLVAENAIKD